MLVTKQPIAFHLLQKKTDWSGCKNYWQITDSDKSSASTDFLSSKQTDAHIENIIDKSTIYMYHFYNDWVSVTKIEYQRLIPEVLLNQYFWLSRVAIGLALVSSEPGVIVNVYILLPLMSILSCTLLLSKKLGIDRSLKGD